MAFEMDEIAARNIPITLPVTDGRTTEGKLIAKLAAELAQRLGPSPSLEQRQCAEQIVRTRLDIEILARKRTDGALTEFESELALRLENTLSRALRRLERLAPATAAKPKGSALAAYIAQKVAERDAEGQAA